MRLIDIFKVGVHVGMTTNAGQVISAMIAGLTGVHVAAGKVQGSLNAIRAAALGAGAVFAGWAVVKGLIDATKHAEKLNHELTKLQTGARLTDGQTDEAKNLAFKVSRDVKGSDVAENVKVQRELFGVFGDMDTAKSLLSTVVQGSRATSNFVDKDTDLAQIAVRALELRGHITKDHKVDPKEFAEEFNAMVRSIVASEGLVDPQKLFMFIRQAGPAARNMSGEQMWGMAPAIMNALGASPAGTATMSLFQQMIGHVVAGERVAHAMEQAGMLTPGKWHTGRGGKVEMDKDAVPDQAGFMDHPFTWLHDHLQSMREQKDKNGKPIDLLGIVQQIFQLSSRQTSARLINDIDSNWPIIENEEKRWKRTPNPDVIAKEQNDKDLSVNIHNLSEAWNNFMAALGGPGIPIAISVLHGLTDALNVMQAAIIAHPTIAKDLFYLAGGLGALTAIGGALVILNVCWAPLATGLRLLVGVPGLAAAGANLSSAAVGLTSIAASAAALPAVIASALAGIAVLAKKGSDAETPENRTIIEQNRRDRGTGMMPTPNDGFGPDGRPASPFVAPNSAAKTGEPIPTKMDAATTQSMGETIGKAVKDALVGIGIIIDGKKVGDVVSNRLADQMSRPQTGTTGPDMRLSPAMPGMGLSY